MDRRLDEMQLEREEARRRQREEEAQDEADESDERRQHTEKSSLLRALHPEGVEWGVNVEDFDPEAVEHLRRWMGVLFGNRRRYFRVSVSGWDNLPPAPVMLASNHSGGTLFLDTWGLLYAWYGHFGTPRPIHPAAHEMLLGNRFTGPFMARRGVIRANRKLAGRVLTEWKNDLLVMPGGDLDVWRPFKKRYEVQFAGRTGYARCALQAGVPVVPVANAGAHHTFLVLTDGRRIAEALHMPEIARASIWPIHLSLPWGIGVGPLPHIPTPAKLRYCLGEAIRGEDVDLGPGETPTDDQVAEFDRLVRQGVQRQLDQLRETA